MFCVADPSVYLSGHAPPRVSFLKLVSHLGSDTFGDDV